MEEYSILDAFKSLEEVEEGVELKNKPIKKVNKNLKEGVNWDFLHKIKKFKENDVLNAIKKVHKKTYDELKEEGFKWGLVAELLTGPEQEKLLKILNSKKEVKESTSNKSIKERIAKINEELEQESSENSTKEMLSKTLKEEPELEPKYDGRKSFYKKAYVDEREDGSKILYSYGTPVVQITKDNKVYLLSQSNGYYGFPTSMTTLRHAKEFLKQNGFKADSLKQMEKDYEYKHCGGNFCESKKSTKEDVIDWLCEHKQVWKDITSFFEVSEDEDSLNKISLDKIEDWIYDHKQLAKDYEQKFNKKLGESKELSESKNINIADDKEVDEAKEFLDDKEEENIEQVVDVDAETVDKLKDSYIGNVILQCPTCRTNIYKKPEDLVKDENNENSDDVLYNVEDVCPHCGATGGFELVGQVASLDVEKDEPESTTGAPEAEEIGTNDEINSEDNLEQDIEEEPNETLEDEDEIKEESYKTKNKYFVVEDLDEKKFDELVNRYLNATYDNVELYETLNGTVDDDNNKIIVEGTIKFKSGKKLNTKFILEAKELTRKNKYRFSCLNETFSNSKKSFTFSGDVKGKKLVCETLTYRYNTKSLNEDKLVKGKIILRQKKH